MCYPMCHVRFTLCSPQARKEPLRHEEGLALARPVIEQGQLALLATWLQAAAPLSYSYTLSDYHPSATATPLSYSYTP